MKLRFEVLVVLLAGVASLAAAQLPLGDEFQVHTVTSFPKFGPSVASDPAGSLVIVWSSDGSDGYGFGIQGQRFDSVGRRLGGEFRVNSYINYDQRSPRVAMDATGFVVAWGSGEGPFGPPGEDEVGVRGQRYDSAGKTLGGEFAVNTYTTEYQSGPAVATDGAGRFVVVWSSYEQDGSGFGVHGQLFNSSGARLGDEFQVNTYTTNNQFLSSVAMHSSGSFITAWSSIDQDGSYRSVYAQRHDPAGMALGAEFRVHTSTLGTQRDAVVAIDESGRFVVVWSSDSDTIHGRRYDSLGVPLSGEFQVNSNTTVLVGEPEVSMHPDGHFVVAWRGFLGGAPLYVHSRIYDSAANPVSDEFKVNPSAVRDQRQSDVSLDAGGQFVVVWGNYDAMPNPGIRAQRYCLPMDLGGGCVFSDGFESGNIAAWSTSSN